MKKILKYASVITLVMLCTGCTKSNENDEKKVQLTDIKPYQVSELIALSRWYCQEKNAYVPPEEEWEEVDDGTFMIKLYENAEDEHTAASAIYTVDAYGKGKDEIMFEDVEFPEVSFAEIVKYMPKPVELTYITNTETHKEWNVKDQKVLEKCFKALKLIKIKEETDVRTTDAEEILAFKLGNGTEWMLTFENGNLMRNSTVYITEGYANVRKVLKEYLEKEGLWD